MFVRISPQTNIRGNKSVSPLVSYLQKENNLIARERINYFFDQRHDQIPAKKVISRIDQNTAALSAGQPRYYSLVISPSHRELAHIGNDYDELRRYAREVMREYPACFNRDLRGREVRPEDILYYGKVETIRRFQGRDPEIRENEPYLEKLSQMKKEFQRSGQHKSPLEISRLENNIKAMEQCIPYRLQGRPIDKGMHKTGFQTHVHVIVSRRDISNQYGLSPGTSSPASTVYLNGKPVRIGFHRDRFCHRAESTFDNLFGYDRNYAERYQNRKLLKKDPVHFYEGLQQLSPSQRRRAWEILAAGKLKLPQLALSQHQVKFALGHLKKAIDLAVRTSAIEY